MKTNDKVMRNRRIGEPSSKYGYQPEQFERDLQAKYERSETLWENFMQFVKDNDMSLCDVSQIFRRFYKEFMG